MLPQGYVDDEGIVHRDGSMRLATAMDEIESSHDPRVLENEAYLPVVLFSRVITRLGSLPMISPRIIEGIYAADLVFLEDLYIRINSPEQMVIGGVCPNCNHPFHLQVAPLIRNW